MTYMLTGRLTDMLLTSPEALDALRGSAVPSQPVINDFDEGVVRLGRVPLIFDQDGNFSVPLVGTDTGSVSAWHLEIDYRDAAAKSKVQTFTSGWFEMTEDTNFLDVNIIVLAPVDTTVLESVYEARDDAEAAQAAAEAAAAEAVDISNISTSDDVVQALIGTSTGPKTQAALQTFVPRAPVIGRLTEAAVRPVRIMVNGTSIATFDNSIPFLVTETMKGIYGDSGYRYQGAGALGGDYQTAQYGWSKQPFGGREFTRLRGSNTSSNIPITTDGGCDRFFVEYSTESNGGSITVYDGATLLGTINCGGAQSYGNRVEFTITTAPHAITIRPGGLAGGAYGYLEAWGAIKSTRVGVEVEGFPLGGSSLGNLAGGQVRGVTGAQVAGINISGNNGVDAFFGRSDIDIVISTFTVNDAGSFSVSQVNSVWKPLLDRAIERTRTKGVELVWIIEMAGHYIMPADPQYASYNRIRDLLLAAGRDNNHVTIIDWDGATRIDSDIVLYASRFYAATGVNPTTGAFSGDFVHPNDWGCELGLGLACARLGLPLPKYQLRSKEESRQRSLVAALDPTPAVVTSRGVAYANRRSGGLARVGSADRRTDSVSFYIADEIAPDPSAVNFAALLAGSGTSDKYGAYWTAAANSVAFGPMNTTDRIQLLVKIGGTWQIRSENASTDLYTGDGIGPLLKDASNRSVVTDTADPVPQWVVLQVATNTNGGTPTISFQSGKVYAAYPVQADKPVITTKSYAAWRGPGPDTYLVGDPLLSTLTIGQTYVEDLAAVASSGLVRKKLVGVARKINSGVSGAGSSWVTDSKFVGCFEALDRTAAGLIVARLAVFTGTTQTGAGYAGGSGDTYNGSSTKQYGGTQMVSALNSSTTPRWTTTFRAPDQSVGSSMIVDLQNGSDFLYLDSTGAWVTTPANLVYANDTMKVIGETLAVSFNLPLSTAIGSAGGAIGTSPYFRIRFTNVANATVFATSTLAKGSSALI